MGLSAHEERTLESIQHKLTGSDPKLAALLVLFTRLSAGEDMPVRERLRPTRRRVTQRRSARVPRDRRSSRSCGAHGHVHRAYAKIGFQRAALALWLLITIVLVTVALALNRADGQDGCPAPLIQSCTHPAPTAHPHADGNFSANPARQAGRD